MTDNLSSDKDFCKQIIDSANEGIIVADVATKKFLYANDTICRMFGYSNDEMRTLSVFDMHPKDDIKAVLKEFELASHGGTDFSPNIPCLRKDGSAFWADISTSRIIMKGTTCNVGFFTDVTDRVKSENETVTLKRLLQSVFDAVPDMLMVIDRSYRIIYTNAKGHELIEQPDEEKAKTCYGRFMLFDEPCDDCTANPVFENGLIVEREKTNPTDGIVREVRSFPIKDSEGKVKYVVEYVRDVSDKKRSEEERLRLEQQIQHNQKLESLGILAGGIAHDFNNLLTGIFGFIDMARTATTEPLVKEYLETTFTTLSRARNLTHQLLTFAKGGTPEMKTGSIGHFLKETVEFALSGSNVTCDFSIPDDLKLVDFDSNQMGQVFDNIVINAQQAMPCGGKLSVKMKNIVLSKGEHNSLPPDSYVKISITDTGVGIPKHIIGRIFDPFFTTKQKGSGLGLATSFSIIKRHGGHIEVESEFEKGSVFHVFLPTSKEVITDDKFSPRVISKGSGFVLVMDDESVVRNSISHMLSHHGYTAVQAKEGREAITLFDEYTQKGTPFCAVILDLTIPGGFGGKETVVEIRKKNIEIPIFASSGYSDDPAIQNPKDFFFTDSIRKPFIRTDLIGLISKYIKP